MVRRPVGLGDCGQEESGYHGLGLIPVSFLTWDGITHLIMPATNLALFSTGLYQGDGNQASHWKDDVLTGSFIGIMDPTAGLGVSHCVL
jgi:hypothetical protein